MSAFVLCIILLKLINNESKPIQYTTAIKEINDLLNEKKSKFKLIENNFIPITLNTDKGTIKFQNYSILKDLNNDKIQFNYKNDTNFISILRIKNNKNILNNISFDNFHYNIESNYYTDELNNPIISFNHDNLSIYYCNNLIKSDSRNYYYYVINNNKIKIISTRANEIFFWYNNYFYYVGIDMNVNNTEILELVKTIIKQAK